MKTVPKSIILYSIALSALSLAVMEVHVYASPNENMTEAIKGNDVRAAQSALKNGDDVNIKERESTYRTVVISVAREGKENLAKLSKIWCGCECKRRTW